MLSLKIAQPIINILSSFIAYILIISPVGCFRAWAAKKMGDTTAEDMGFLTLNPAPHLDFVGILVLIFFGVGWGKHIPINPLNIEGKRRGLKLTCAYFSDTFAHLVLATLGLILFILLFGAHSLSLYATEVSSLGISIARILNAFINLNVILAAIALIINLVMVVGILIAERNVQFPPYFFYFVILAPIIMLVIFGEDIRQCMFYCIFCLGKLFAKLFGIH